MTELLTVGETMAVFVPVEDGPLRYSTGFRMRAAGAESNVAIGLSKLGHKAAWASCLGEDEPGHFVLNSVRAEGVDVSRVWMDAEHATGLMLKETGNRETRVFYYRENSTASHLDKRDAEKLWIPDVKILHLTGIMPVLSEGMRKYTETLFDKAKEANISVSFDPNIRKRLWKKDDYREMIRKFTLRAEIVLLGREEGEILFGTGNEQEIIDILFEKGCSEYVAVKDGSRGAVVSDGRGIYQIPAYACRSKDPVGAGDGFNAGFLCGILENQSVKICGKMGGIVGALATETTGDFEGYPSRKQLDRILKHEEVIYR